MQLGDEQKAAEAIATARGIAAERIERSHVEVVEQSLPMHRSDHTMGRRENKPFVFVTNTGETLITVEEATKAIDAAPEDGYLILDWRVRAPEFTGPLDTVHLEPRVAELLDYLLTNPGYLTTQQIKQTI